MSEDLPSNKLDAMRNILAALVFVITATYAVPVGACSCTPHTLSDDVRNAKSITLARVVSARDVPPSGPDRLDQGISATVEVVEVLKGTEQTKRREIFFSRLCGVEVVVSSNYVIFETNPGFASRCTGTVRLTGENPSEDSESVEQIRKAVHALASN